MPKSAMTIWDTSTNDGAPLQGKDGAALVTQATLLAGEDQTNNVIRTEQQFEYEVVPVTTQTTLGATGAAGDLLHKILAENATTAIAIHDGATLVYTWTITAATEPNELELNVVATTAWKLTCTGAGATAIGRFT